MTSLEPEVQGSFSETAAHVLANPRAGRAEPYGDDLRGVISLAGWRLAQEEISAWPGYAPTPLRRLNGLAAALGYAELLYKDEASRFGLSSFKALGGAYGVLRAIQEEVRRRTGSKPSATQLMAAEARQLVSAMKVVCATDGNHGRSVAWGAQLFGCRCTVYLHAKVSEQRGRAIASLGAQVVRTAGDYDESVRVAGQEADANGYLLVADTSHSGYLEVPRDVMQGYTVMVGEVVDQLRGHERPTHMFVQGGVGGLAAAASGHLWECWGDSRPVVVVVEPERADCLYRSALAGRPTQASGDLDTVMAGLSCGEPSLLAWRVLERGADFFMTIPDEVIAPTMRLLAVGTGGDPSVVSGESGAAGLAALAAASSDEEVRRRLQLDGESRVLVFGTEGATDPDLYRRLVGHVSGAQPTKGGVGD